MNPCDLFTTGMIFEKSSGRTTAFYNDVSRETLSLDNTTFTSGSNVAIMETTYILGVTEEYENIFNKIQKSVDKLIEVLYTIIKLRETTQ